MLLLVLSMVLAVPHQEPACRHREAQGPPCPPAAVAYRYRTVRLDRDGGPLATMDGIVQLDFQAGGVVLHERYVERRAEDGMQPVYRDQVNLLSATSGETASCARLLGSSERSAFLSTWSRLPDVFQLARGTVPPLDAEPTQVEHGTTPEGRTACRARFETDGFVFEERREFEGERLVQWSAAEGGGRLRRVIRFGPMDAAASTRGFARTWVAADLDGEGRLEGAAAYELLDGLLRSPEEVPFVPATCEVLDLRGSEPVRAVRTDRPLPLAALSAWLPPAGAAVGTAAGPAPLASRSVSRFPSWSWALLAAGAVLLASRIATRSPRGGTAALFLALNGGGPPSTPEEEALASARLALGLRAVQGSAACPAGGHHAFTVAARFPGDPAPDPGLTLVDELGLGNVAGPQELTTITEHCSRCGSARDPGRVVLPAGDWLRVEPREPVLRAATGQDPGVVLRVALAPDAVLLQPAVGCGVTCSFKEPQPPDPAVAQVQVRVDRHHPLAQVGGVLILEASDGARSRVPFRVEDPPFVPMPSRAVLERDGALRVVFAGAGLERVSPADVPGCLEVESCSLEGEDGVLLVRDRGSARHTCGPLKVNVWARDDSVPCERWVWIEHALPPLDGSKMLVCSARLLPGETVWLAYQEDLRAPFLICPDRLPEAELTLDRPGIVPLARFRAPTTDGPFALEEDQGGLPVRLAGRVESGLETRLPSRSAQR